MITKFIMRCVVLSYLAIAANTFAQENEASLGQMVEIKTNLSSFVGKPAWLLVIRDVDNGQNIPYLFDFRRGNNTWIAFTYSRNYLILASTLRFSPYQVNPYYTSKEITNFCNIESNGRIIRGESLFIRVEGSLTPYNRTFTCHVRRFPGPSAGVRTSFSV